MTLGHGVPRTQSTNRILEDKAQANPRIFWGYEPNQHGHLKLEKLFVAMNEGTNVLLVCVILPRPIATRSL